MEWKGQPRFREESKMKLYEIEDEDKETEKRSDFWDESENEFRMERKTRRGK